MKHNKIKAGLRRADLGKLQDQTQDAFDIISGTPQLTSTAALNAALMVKMFPTKNNNGL